MNQNKLVITRELVKQFTFEACISNEMPETFFEEFWERLMQRDDIYKEYVYYLVKHDFSNEVDVEGYHVIDILIWQIDHFKARMDMDNVKHKQNEAVMILTAFDTFLKMAENPEEYTLRLQVDTGTEYPDKFYGLHK